MSNSTATDRMDAAGESAILDRVLCAIHHNRQPGSSFAGDMLDLFSELTPGGARMTLASAAHILDAAGLVDPLCFGAFVDVALARAVRAAAGYSARMATSLINLRLNGAPLRAPIVANGVFDGWSVGTEGRFAASRVELLGPDGPVGSASGQFAALGGPDQTVRFYDTDRLAPLAPADLRDREHTIFALASDALRRARSKGTTFIAEFWGIDMAATDTGARSTFRYGPHADNLVGQLQGGLQIGLAEVTAAHALGPDWLMTTLNACFLRAGVGAEFVTTSDIVHRGRTTAVSVNRVRDEQGRTVLETTSTHARRAAGSG